MARMEIVSNGNGRHNLPHELFGQWIYERCKKNGVVTMKECGNFLASTLSRRVDEEYVKKMVIRAREYTESSLLQYIVAVPGIGWKIAEGNERPRYVSKVSHITKKWIDRLIRAGNALHKSEIPALYKEEEIKYRDSLEKTSKYGNKFAAGYLTYLKKTKEKVENETKLIESKS